MNIQAIFKLRWAVLLTVAVILVLQAGIVHAAENAGIGGKPAYPRAENPRTESIFVYELAPGQSTEDGVQIFNNTEVQKTIEVYATDAVVSSGGAFACAQAVDPINDVGSWIKLEKTTVTLAPGTNQVISFTVTLPSTTEPGEHNGCIAIQEANTEAANVGNGIALNFRSAIRVAITVPGDIKKELSINSVDLTNKEDVLIGAIQLKNNGNVSLDATVDTELVGIFGRIVQVIDGTYPALPQTVTELNFEYSQPYWGGFYALDTTVSYNANVDESLGEGSATKQETKSSKYVFVMPQTSALFIELAVIGVLAVVGWLLWRKFVVHPKLAKKYHDYTVKKGDNIQQIAKNNNVKWKHLAQINNIKAPYALSVGSVIKVPNKPDIATTEQSVSKTVDIQEKPVQEVIPEEKPTSKKVSQVKKPKPSKKPRQKKPIKKKPTPKKKPTTKKKPTKKEQ